MRLCWRAIASPSHHLLRRRHLHLRPFSAAPASEDSVFDSRDFSLPPPPASATAPPEPSWNQTYRDRADRKIFGEGKEEVGEEERRANRLAKALLWAALEKPDEEVEARMIVKEEDQRSLSVGIIGAPNAGKSALTNFMVCLYIYISIYISCFSSSSSVNSIRLLFANFIWQ